MQSVVLLQCGIAMTSCPSISLSVCNVEVQWSYRSVLKLSWSAAERRSGVLWKPERRFGTSKQVQGKCRDFCLLAMISLCLACENLISWFSGKSLK